VVLLVNGEKMKQNIYAGVMALPSDNFESVRDGRDTFLRYLDVDLTSARTEASALTVNASGNSFYVDANPSDGVAAVEFQDSAADASTARLYVSPGAIFSVPFTQFKITNAAQAGKKIRIVYGVDVDFQPGSVSQISLAGSIAPYPITPVLSSFAVATVSTSLYAANASRKYLCFVNHGAYNVYINFAASAFTGTGLLLTPGQSWESGSTCPVGLVSAISLTAACSVAGFEG
jgi:hypothetical protein